MLVGNLDPLKAPFAFLGSLLVRIWRMLLALLVHPRTEVLAIHRFAVKGLSFDAMRSVKLKPGESLPNDRKWALHFEDATEGFVAASPEWLHKSNFLCAFTANELLGSLSTSFDDATSSLRVSKCAAQLLDAKLDEEEGRVAAAAFFSDVADRRVRVVSGDSPHHFGNTQAGVKASGDTRVLHIVNANTVAALSAACGEPLHPERFRPNLIIGGALPAWEEFGWVGREVRVGGTTLRVLKRTVRCPGINVDSRHGSGFTDLDLPALLQEHFPEHGPYLGVYAQVIEGGEVSLGDRVVV